jgi:hypothetical protein
MLLYERKMEVNLSAKKSFDIRKFADVSTDFDYYDGTTHYQFKGKTDIEPEDSLFSEKISTGYWKYYAWDLPYLPDEMVKDIGKWKEENGKFVVDNPSTVIEEYIGSKYFVTLSENNRYLKVEIKSATGEILETYDFSYTANPVFPVEYQPVQFPAVKQYSVNVNWGETYGKDTYYTSFSRTNDNSLQYFNMGLGETPKVTGKMPLLYYDEAHTQLILDDSEKTGFYVDYNYDESVGYYWFFSGDLSAETDGTTVYAQWEDAETVYKQYGNE